jgi:hypothetical protein
MRILILHDLIPLRQLRRQLLNQAFFFLKYCTGIQPVLHAYGDPIDESIKTGDYDAIFLDVSFLCWRWASPFELVEKFTEDYAWLADHPAPKFAFPQDDYDRHAVLDDWMIRWKVDSIFTPLPGFAEVLYPRASKTAKIRPFLTGFVDDVDLAIADRSFLPIRERPVDVVYRARPLPANFGELGQLKKRIADAFAPACERAGLKHDVTTDPERTIFGDQWLDFLGSSRYVLGTPSGSSVLDPRGDIAAAVAAYAREHPTASFDEIRQACIPPEATSHNMEAISPRVLEAALTGTCQVLVKGAYGPLEPGRHYIPIERDLSNIEQVIAGLSDHDRAQRIADDCRALIISSTTLHYRHAASAVEEAIRQAWRERGEPERPNLDPTEITGAAKEQIEQILHSGLRERQRLLHSLADDIARQMGIPTFTPDRYSDIGRVLAAYWNSLSQHAASAGAAPAAGEGTGRPDLSGVPFGVLVQTMKDRILQRLSRQWRSPR